MGCPYEARFIFGITITEEQRDLLEKKMDEMEKDPNTKSSDYVQIDGAYAGNDDAYYYIDLSNSYNTVSNCEVIRSVRNFDTMKDKAIKAFNECKMIQDMFSESDVEPLLICTYCG
jgi:hypothetical protein